MVVLQNWTKSHLATTGNSTAAPHSITNSIACTIQQSHLWAYGQSSWSQGWKGYFSLHNHCTFYTAARVCKQFIDRLINEGDETLSKLKREEHSTTWDTMDRPGGHHPGETNQTQKDKYHIIPLIWVIHNSQTQKNRGKNGGYEKPEGRRKQLPLKGHQAPIRDSISSRGVSITTALWSSILYWTLKHLWRH